MSKKADKLVAGFGSWGFVWSFTAVTGGWVIASVFGLDKDLQILTFVLSVLAIYLTIFILISQNNEQRQFAEWLKEDLKNTKAVNAKLDKALKGKK